MFQLSVLIFNLILVLSFPKYLVLFLVLTISLATCFHCHLLSLKVNYICI